MKHAGGRFYVGFRVVSKVITYETKQITGRRGRQVQGVFPVLRSIGARENRNTEEEECARYERVLTVT